jgi:hypothetical protein
MRDGPQPDLFMNLPNGTSDRVKKEPAERFQQLFKVITKGYAIFLTIPNCLRLPCRREQFFGPAS